MISAREKPQHAPGVFVTRGLAEYLVSKGNDCVGGQNDISRRPASSARLLFCEASDEGSRGLAWEAIFGNEAGLNRMVQTRGEKQLMAAWRGGGQNQHKPQITVARSWYRFGVSWLAGVARVAVIGALGLGAQAAPSSRWTVVRSSHFEVYSQAGAEPARGALRWFEQLRAFFEQRGLPAGERSPVRVIGFRSRSEYDAYRLRPTADAYYIGTESRDYIVMPTLGAAEFAIAAHEYAHLVLHASGFKIPAWLNEGLAEYFSTVRIGNRGCEIAGAIARHAQTLRHTQWMNLAELLALRADSSRELKRDTGALFYAQSWALTDMLATSAEYRSGFRALIAAIGSGQPSAEALTAVYRKPLEAIAADLRGWVDRASPQSIELPGVVVGGVMEQESELSPFASQALLADLLLASGKSDRAEALYRDLARESPGNAEVPAALGAIAFRKGENEVARREFKQALDRGLRDAGLYYRYAVLAEDAGAAPSDIRSALEHALALKPDFDEARYKLALLESNAGDYEAAVSQLRAMTTVGAARAYDYWSALAYALGELGRRDEAVAAAGRAMEHATTPAERTRAAQIAYVAQTDLTVQFTRDASGHLQLVTTRVAHGAAGWNPFIEPGDRIRHVEGQLRNIECGGNKVTGVDLDTKDGALKLAIPDPLHVLMRNAPSEFVCGPQAASAVSVEYAASGKSADAGGVLRGMEFR